MVRVRTSHQMQHREWVRKELKSRCGVNLDAEWKKFWGNDIFFVGTNFSENAEKFWDMMLKKIYKAPNIS